MALTGEQFKAIEPHLPTHRGNVKIDNMTVINALLHEMYEGCTWRGLPPKSNRREPWRLDAEKYKKQNEVERMFGQMKEIRRVATRYDNLDATYFSFVQLTFIAIALRRLSVNTP